MSNRTLPFYSSFFNTFEKHVIDKWEAKDFITNILERHPHTSRNKQKVYQGINVLIQCGYLKRTVNPRKKNTFLYTETEEILNYRSSKSQENIAKALNEKMNIVQEHILVQEVLCN